jgi:hypothetical protein
MAEPNVLTPPAPTPEVDAELVRLRAENATQVRALALAQAKIDFPKADAEILSAFEGTAEALRGFAEKLHTKTLELEARQAAPPTPTPGPGGSTSAEEAVATRYRELRTKVLGRYAEPHERQEFLDLAFAHGWNSHNVERKVGVRAG